MARKRQGNKATAGSAFSIGGINKSASIFKTGATNTTTTSSMFYSPELTTESWLLPKSRQEILKWVRIFFNLEPYVQQITKMHSYYPFSKFEIMAGDESVEKFYKEMAFNKDFDLFEFILRASLSYNKFGEAIPFGNMVQDGKYWKWKKFVLMEPELVEIKQEMFEGEPLIEMIPNEELKNLIKSTKDEDMKRLETLKEQAPIVYECIINNKNIPLSNDHVSIIADYTDNSATRGTSPIQCLFKCLSGDTRIALLDGTNPTLKELCDSGKTNFWVYSVNPETQEMIPVQAQGVMYMGERETIEITLDNNESFKCTPDHKLMLRDGTYKEAKDLVAGDSMMPLYRRYDNQYKKTNKNTSLYEKLYNPATGKWVFTHVLTVLNCKREDTKGKGKYVIHHQNVHSFDNDKPFYSLDNTPENLLVLSKEDHTSLHRKYSATPERMKELSKLATIARKENGHYKMMEDLWADPEWKARNITSRKNTYANQSNEFKMAKDEKIRNTHIELAKENLKLTVEKLQKDSKEFQIKHLHLPTITELSDISEFKRGKVYWTVNKVGEDIIGVLVQHKKGRPRKQKIAVLNHKVINIKYTGKIEKVYDVINSGLYHNFVISFDDKSGIIGTNCLIYQDWIRLAQSAFAQRYVFPIELWKLGDPLNNLNPTDQDLTDFRNLLNQAIQNPPFVIVYPDIVKYEAVSVSGKNFPVNNEYEYIIDQILVGMGVNKNLILGEGPSFSNVRTMSLHKLMMMYKTIRDKFENWMINSYFRPIAEKNGFYTTENGEKKLILPTISWNKSLDIEEEHDEREQYVQFHEKGIISTKTLYRKFPNLKYEEEQKNLEDERGTIFDKGGERLPKKISKPSKGRKGGGGVLPGGGGISVGEIPPMPIEPEAPEGEKVPGEGVPTPPEAATSPTPPTV